MMEAISKIESGGIQISGPTTSASASSAPASVRSAATQRLVFFRSISSNKAFPAGFAAIALRVPNVCSVRFAGFGATETASEST